MGIMALLFLALPVIPELTITDRGLVDVKQFEHVAALYILIKEWVSDIFKMID